MNFAHPSCFPPPPRGFPFRTFRELFAYFFVYSRDQLEMQENTVCSGLHLVEIQPKPFFMPKLGTKKVVSICKQGWSPPKYADFPFSERSIKLMADPPIQVFFVGRRLSFSTLFALSSMGICTRQGYTLIQKGDSKRK